MPYLGWDTSESNMARNKMLKWKTWSVAKKLAEEKEPEKPELELFEAEFKRVRKKMEVSKACSVSKERAHTKEPPRPSGGVQVLGDSAEKLAKEKETEKHQLKRFKANVKQVCEEMEAWKAWSVSKERAPTKEPPWPSGSV